MKPYSTVYDHAIYTWIIMGINIYLELVLNTFYTF